MPGTAKNPGQEGADKGAAAVETNVELANFEWDASESEDFFGIAGTGTAAVGGLS